MPADIPDWLLEERAAIGRRVRAAREDARLSQEQLAHVAGIARHTVYRTELGTHAASVDVLLRLAHALGVPLSRFTDGS
mgnify:CR=1 FL=1